MITRDRNVINIDAEGDFLDETVAVQAIRFHSVPTLLMAVAEIREGSMGDKELHFSLEARRGHPDYIGLPLAPVWLHGGFKVTRFDSGRITIYLAYSNREDDPIV